jgi:uncharacterized protein with HEPN domain
MRLELLSLLHDMRVAAEAILDYTRGRTLEEFLSDRSFRSAVEREFILAGEALNQAASIDPDITASFTGGQDIIEFRHILVHGYRRVEAVTVWGIIEDDVPLFLAEVRAAMGDLT